MKMSFRFFSLLIFLILIACSNERNVKNAALEKPDFHRGMHIYNAFCAECHETGKNGAPGLDDVDEWDLRAMQWSSVLKEHVNNGFMDMPSKGGHAELSDQNIADALYYMEVKIRANED